jgi:SAM-dependent methyltransferase
MNETNYDRSTLIDEIATALRQKIAVDDSLFDRLYPIHVQRLSGLHFTPVSVALRAAALLAPEAGLRVLDAGAGAGKLCVIAALSHAGRWHGVEADPSLVAVASAVASELAVADRASFAGGDLFALDWRAFDSLYFYNPFEAALFSRGPRDPQGGDVVAERVAAAQQRLAELASGTRVVVFHGLGGDMPSGFTRAAGDGELALWVKQPRRPVPR